MAANSRGCLLQSPALLRSRKGVCSYDVYVLLVCLWLTFLRGRFCFFARCRRGAKFLLVGTQGIAELQRKLGRRVLYAACVAIAVFIQHNLVNHFAVLRNLIAVAAPLCEQP